METTVVSSNGTALNKLVGAPSIPDGFVMLLHWWLLATRGTEESGLEISKQIYFHLFVID